MAKYLLVWHLKGDGPATFGCSSIPAQNENEARARTQQLLKDWKDNEDLLGKDDRDQLILTKVIEEIHVK